jgi:hypothetical protein
MIDEKPVDDTYNSTAPSGRVEEAAASTDPSSDEAVRLSAARKKNGRRVTDELRWAMYEDWKAGCRYTMTLARRHGVTFSTAKAVMEGNPRRDWPSFEAQLALGHETLKSAQAIASEKIAETVLTEWEKARKEDLAMVQGTKASTWALIKKLAEASKTVDFIRTEIDKDGNVHKVPMGPSEALSAARTAAQTMDLIVKIESLLHDKPTENKKVVVERERWANLTPEQLEAFAVTGKWPEGVSEDDVLGKAPTPKN